MRIKAVENKWNNDSLISWHDCELQEFLVRWQPQKGDFAYEFAISDIEVITEEMPIYVERKIRIFILWSKNLCREISDESWGDFHAWLKGYSPQRKAHLTESHNL